MNAADPRPEWVSQIPVFVLLWVAGLYLRMPIMMGPPLAPRIAEDLGLGGIGTGALTTIPVLLLSVAALAGAFMITVTGARRAVAIGLLIVAITSTARGLAMEPWQLYLITAAMGLGIAVVQPALPALLTVWCPGRVALGTAVYMNGMLVGEVIGAGLTIPLFLPMAGQDWRLALAIVSLPALLCVAGFALYRRPGEERAAQAVPIWMPAWRHSLVWRMGLLLGTSGSLFFGANAYMATVLAGRGEVHLLAVGLLLFNSAQVAASMLAFRYAGRWVRSSGPTLLAMTSTALLCMVLFLLLPGAPALLAAFVVSFTTGIMLILLVTLPPSLAFDEGPAPLAAGMYTVGYALSFAVPLLGGVLLDLTGYPAAAMAPAMVLAMVALPLCMGLPRAGG